MLLFFSMLCGPFLVFFFHVRSKVAQYLNFQGLVCVFGFVLAICDFFFFFFFFFLDCQFYVFDCVYESRITSLFFYSVSAITPASKSIVTLCLSHNKNNQKIQLFENNPCFATLGHLGALFLSSTAAAATTTTAPTITIAM